MMVHGGGFISGNKDNMAKFCQRFADSGFVAATVEYRMGWTVRDPISKGKTQLNTQMAASYRANQDVNAAMRYIVSKANYYAIDTNKIFVGGASAGALATLALRSCK
jgi:acetyl esterase/lipase